MTIFVTGSEGFIGRHLVADLKSKGQDVVGFDIKTHPLLYFKGYDFSDIKAIYHLGAISSTTERDVSRIKQYNTEFSFDLFEIAIRYQIPVVYASSGSVYGNTMVDGQYIYNPLNYYAASKMMIDMWVTENMDRFASVHGLRFFNVYGQNERKDDMSTSPIYRFSEQAKNDGVIKIFRGSHKTYRDFVCVEDVVAVMQDRLSGRGGWIPASGIFDVGTGKPISFMDVADMVSSKYQVPIKFIDMPEQLKGKYQTYTKARSNGVLHNYTSVKDWLETH